VNDAIVDHPGTGLMRTDQEYLVARDATSHTASDARRTVRPSTVLYGKAWPLVAAALIY
jgi:hypothetical protein